MAQDDVTDVENPRYRRLVREVTETVAMPHTYTLLIWCTTMVTVFHHGIPDPLSILCLLAGACAAYVVVGRFAAGLRVADPAAAPRVVTHPYLVACGNFGTLAVATGVCAVVSLIPVVPLAWLAVGVAGTTVFLLGIAAQAVLARRFVRG